MGRRRISQTALAEALGMSQPSLSKRLSGDQAFSLDELLAVAAFFDVEVTALLVGLTQGGSPLPWMSMPTESDIPGISVTQCEGQESLLAALAA